MGPKKKGGGKKGGGKAKEPDFQTDDPFLLDHFGVGVRDVVRTPLGMEGEVIGVKTPDKENPATWQLWLQYPNDFKAPIQAKNKEDMHTFGYRRSGDARHIRRDMAEEAARRKVWDEGQLAIAQKLAEEAKVKMLEEMVEKKGKK